MHPDDERVVAELLTKDPSLVFVDGPRWKSSTPPISRSLEAVGDYCIIWSTADLSELDAEYIPTCNDWYCRAEHSTIQFLRSSIDDASLIAGRFAMRTTNATAHAAAAVTRRLNMLRRFIKKHYKNSVIRWQNPTLPFAPAGPSRSANPGRPDSSLWVGPSAMAWLTVDRDRRVRQVAKSPVEGFVERTPE